MREQTCEQRGPVNGVAGECQQRAAGATQATDVGLVGHLVPHEFEDPGRVLPESGREVLGRDVGEVGRPRNRQRERRHGDRPQPGAVLARAGGHTAGHAAGVLSSDEPGRDDGQRERGDHRQ